MRKRIESDSSGTLIESNWIYLDMHLLGESLVDFETAWGNDHGLIFFNGDDDDEDDEEYGTAPPPHQRGGVVILADESNLRLVAISENGTVRLTCDGSEKISAA